MAEPITIGGQTFIKTGEGWVDQKSKIKAPEGLLSLLNRLQVENSPEGKKKRVRIDTSRQGVKLGKTEYVWDLNSGVWIDKKTKDAANPAFSKLIEAAYQSIVQGTTEEEKLYESWAKQAAAGQVFSGMGVAGQAAKQRAKTRTGSGQLPVSNIKINSPIVQMIQKLSTIDSYLKQRLNNQKLIAANNIAAMREASIEDSGRGAGMAAPVIDEEKIKKEAEKENGKSNGAILTVAAIAAATLVSQLEPVKEAFSGVVDLAKGIYGYFKDFTNITNRALESINSMFGDSPTKEKNKSSTGAGSDSNRAASPGAATSSSASPNTGAPNSRSTNSTTRNSSGSAATRPNASSSAGSSGMPNNPGSTSSGSRSSAPSPTRSTSPSAKSPIQSTPAPPPAADSPARPAPPPAASPPSTPEPTPEPYKPPFTPAPRGESLPEAVPKNKPATPSGKPMPFTPAATLPNVSLVNRALSALNRYFGGSKPKPSQGNKMLASSSGGPAVISNIPGYNPAGSQAAKRPQPQAPTPVIFDLTHLTKGRFNFGKLKARKGFVIHHTAGRGTAEAVINTFKNTDYPTQYIIDRAGKIYRALPAGNRGQHIRGGYGPIGTGLSNANTEGVEIIAKNDKDVLPIQVEAAKKLIKMLGYSPDQIYGHEEVNPGRRMKTEGMTIVNAVRGTLKPRPGGGKDIGVKTSSNDITKDGAIDKITRGGINLASGAYEAIGIIAGATFGKQKAHSGSQLLAFNDNMSGNIDKAAREKTVAMVNSKTIKAIASVMPTAISMSATSGSSSAQNMQSGSDQAGIQWYLARSGILKA